MEEKQLIGSPVPGELSALALLSPAQAQTLQGEKTKSWVSVHSRFKGFVTPRDSFPNPCKTEPPKILGHFLVSQPSTTITSGCTRASSITQWELELMLNDNKNQYLTAWTVSCLGRGKQICGATRGTEESSLSFILNLQKCTTCTEARCHL